MHWLPQARPIILLFFLPPFSFGMLILTRQQYLVVVTWVLGLYAALLGYEFVLYQDKFMIQYQLFLFVIYAILLFWFAIFGGFISNLRRRLKTKSDDMKKVNEEINIEIEERKRLEKDLKAMASTDFLTGVMNRRYFFDKAADEISRHKRFNHPVTVLMLDIDYFKNVNDTYGHPAGDFIIRSVADILKAEVRKNDLICRFGGEEFALLMVETDYKEAVDSAHRLLTKIKNEPFKFEDHSIKITASIGLTTAIINETKDSIHTLISRSDKALYRAKERGRDRIETNSPQPGFSATGSN